MKTILIFLFWTLFCDCITAQTFFYVSTDNVCNVQLYILPAHKDIYINSLKNEILQQQNTEIYVAIYSFTYTPLKDALVLSLNQGCTVYVIVDPQQASTTSLDEELELAGVYVKRKRTNSSSLMHDKYILIEQQNIVWTGSANWSSASLSQDNNILRLQNFKQLYTMYKTKFFELWNK